MKTILTKKANQRLGSKMEDEKNECWIVCAVIKKAKIAVKDGGILEVDMQTCGAVGMLPVFTSKAEARKYADAVEKNSKEHVEVIPANFLTIK